jgi:hypothetical protein
MLSIQLDKINLKDIPKYFTISVFILALTMPGFGFLYVTNQTLLLELSPTQLIFTILLYSLPIFLLWLVERVIVDKSDGNRILIIQEASLNTVIYFYVFLIVYKVARINYNFPIGDANFKYSFPYIDATLLLFLCTIFSCVEQGIESLISNKLSRKVKRKNKPTKNIYHFPIDLSKVTSTQNDSLSHVGDFINSIDYDAQEGTPIYAALDGVVISVKDDSNKGGLEQKFEDDGNFIEILHKHNEISEYEHLRQHSAKVKIGDRVSAGQIIAEVGNTGWSECPHLHFMVYPKGESYKTIKIHFQKNKQ